MTADSPAVLLAQADEKLRAAQLLLQGLFPREFTILLTRLYENRQAGDYEAMLSVTEEDARRDVADAQRIVEAVRQFLSS